MRKIALFILTVVTLSACRDARIHEEKQWGKFFEEQGIKTACFMLRDNNHEAIHYYNKERCLQQYLPASTFKIFNSLVGLDIPKVPDEAFVIPWDSVDRGREEINRDMNMREAFKLSNIGYYQELARRVGPDYMQHYLDTVNYGNKRMGTAVDSFWVNDTLKISADEQVGFVKRLYFNELPFSERSQRIVRNMMLQEETPGYKLYYKTGWGYSGTKQILWVVGFIERIEHVKEHENAMNKSDIRMYPYFFALNFELDKNDETKDWGKVRIDILKNVLKEFGAITSDKPTNKK